METKDTRGDDEEDLPRQGPGDLGRGEPGPGDRGRMEEETRPGQTL